MVKKTYLLQFKLNNYSNKFNDLRHKSVIIVKINLLVSFKNKSIIYRIIKRFSSIKIVY